MSRVGLSAAGGDVVLGANCQHASPSLAAACLRHAMRVLGPSLPTHAPPPRVQSCDYLHMHASI